MKRSLPPIGDKPEVIYVGGYGRSGSTLLGRVLAERSAVVHLGEVARGARKASRAGRMCTCGRRVDKCRAWSLTKELEPLVGETASADAHAALLQTVLDKGPWKIVVDTSKTAPGLATRPAALRRRLAADFTLIHLVRDPRAVVWSVIRDEAADRPLSRFAQAMLALQTAAGWVYANLACELFRIRHPRAYVRVRYEEAMAKGLPEPLQRFATPRPLAGRRLANKSNNNHALSGNPMRHDESVVIEPDDEWRTAMPRPLAALTLAIGGPLAAVYGMFRRDAASPLGRQGASV